MPVSVIQAAKRFLVNLLLTFARHYQVTLTISRESEDKDVVRAFKKMILKAHPDKGGREGDAQKLNTAREAWDNGKKSSNPRPQPATTPSADDLTISLAHSPQTAKQNFRIHSVAVLLTYFGLSGLSHWNEFLVSLRGLLKTWKVWRWCATLEESKAGKLHAHVMLQFHAAVDRFSDAFAVDGLKPNAGPNGPGKDYMGDGFCRNKLQQSINRGMFYVWADKIGTCRDEFGNPCVDGNYGPAWTEGFLMRYRVLSKWAETLWQEHKLDHPVYGSYILKSRDGYIFKKRNLEAAIQGEQEEAELKEIAENTKRIRSNVALYQPFPEVARAVAWLKTFSADMLRYPLLVVLGPSGSGKTEWAKSLFTQPLELKVGSLTTFPDGMRAFNRKVHDGIILDDVRDMAFITDNQDKLQGKYDAHVEFATTQGGTCAYKKYLFATPIVVTGNFSTANLSFLQSHDWLGRDLNRVVVEWGESLGANVQASAP